MPTSRSAAVPIFMGLWTVLVLVGIGCVPESGGSSFQGAGVLRGFVTQVDAGGQTFSGGVEGVSVSVVGTDLKATTADDGLFIISGVPPGDNLVSFQFMSASAQLRVNVPESAEVNLNAVRIRDDKVEADDIDVIRHEPEDKDDRSGSGGGGNDDSGPGGGGDDDDGTDGDGDDDGGADDDGDDDDNPNGDDDPAQEGEEADQDGPIQSLSASAITMNGVTFAITGNTIFLDDDGQLTTLAAFAVGNLVDVEGRIVSGQLVAEKVEAEN